MVLRERARERDTHTPPPYHSVLQCNNAHINTRSMLQNFAKLPITYLTSVMAPNHSFHRHSLIMFGGRFNKGWQYTNTEPDFF